MRPGPDPRATRWIAVRIGALAVLLAAGFAIVAGRAFQLQVLRRDALVEEMVDQYRRQLVLKPRRGVITDRSGVLLAGSADARSVFADPVVLEKEDGRGEALRKVCQALKLDLGAARRKLGKGSRFVWIARRISPAQAAQVEAILKASRVRGLALVPETRRYYPKLELASQVLGLVGDDGEGLEGVELGLDEVLRGEPAKVPSLRDGAGKTVLGEAPTAGQAREGARVELALDQGIQLSAERALGAAVKRSRALSGMAVALDPRTGEVLAMASFPPYNPNAPKRGAELRNRAVTDSFEPGSTVKTFTIAGALAQGALRPLDPIDCGNGRYAIGAHVIHDHEALGWAGASKILAVSSNIGAAKIGARLGRAGLHESLAAFGLGEKTGVGLPGEIRGQLPPPRSEVALATQSFGHGLTANALQITTAMAAIANGGKLMRPIAVRRVVDPATGEVLQAAAPEVVRQAVPPDVAETMTRFLVGVVEDPKGTGKRARLAGWRVAGKTGTARKVDPVSGGYASDRHFSSFVGFAPAEAPRVVVGVFLDEPKGDVHGGEVAAPAFREIVEDVMRLMGVPATGPEAERLALAAAAPVEEEPEGPPPVELAARAAAPVDGASVAVPSLAGLPARSAIRSLERADLAPELDGSGRVVQQWPAAGKVVERGTRVRMRLAPTG
ncbi:penicillin-binding protein [Anaeromyxobacter terrae]|uniref:penicillin-binding protein n=1 Tax=Anaeromyxobacter terrae TaxID=2925406 RepID=UPI001F5A5622|nr:penicillin-binding protein [Anaeromyxobacter sp. SG22]